MRTGLLNSPTRISVRQSVVEANSTSEGTLPHINRTLGRRIIIHYTSITRALHLTLREQTNTPAVMQISMQISS